MQWVEEFDSLEERKQGKTRTNKRARARSRCTCGADAIATQWGEKFAGFLTKAKKFGTAAAAAAATLCRPSVRFVQCKKGRERERE